MLKYWPMVAILALFVITCSDARSSSGATLFVAQSAGTFSGGNACNGQRVESIATFNSGTQTAGNTYYLCGTITTTLNINGSGTSGSVITFLWDSGARITQPVGQGINLNGGSAFLLFDGGTACGPRTNCDTVEAANQTGYATGQAGIIEATANGSALANQNPTSQAFYGCTNGCHDIEIRNLIIRNLYQHSSLSDATANADGGTFVFSCVSCAPGTISIHDNTIHDSGNAISLTKTSATTLNVFNNDFYHVNWAVAPTGSGTRMVNVYKNHLHDASNWDTSSDSFHHNGVHVFMNTASDSLGLNIYNNLSDGNWGNCCTTATQVFIDTGGFSTPNNVNVFNNVSIQYPGNLAPAWEYAGQTGIFANNTAIGVLATPSNVNPVTVGATSTGITFENNVIENYGQHLYIQPGATFATFDYNSYGPVGQSGNNSWQYGTNGTNSFPAWPAICSCDSHGQSNLNLSLNTQGAALSGSPLVNSGANLTDLCVGSVVALCSDYYGSQRSATGAWTPGAFLFGTPNPPTGLTGTPTVKHN